MGLTDALYTGLSGLNVNQTTMGVVGNSEHMNVSSGKAGRSRWHAGTRAGAAVRLGQSLGSIE